MADPHVIWDLPDEPYGNFVHIVVDNDISKAQVEEVLGTRQYGITRSRSSGRPILFGWTSTGRYIAVIWEEVLGEPRTIRPVTAFEAEPPSRRYK